MNRWMFLLLLPLGCTDGCESRDLLTLPAKANLEGSYCTTSNSQRGVPLRIMAIVDTSGSMRDTDPTGGRFKATSDLINSFGADVDVEFAIVTFDDGGTPATIDPTGKGVFTRDATLLSEALNKLGRQDGFTNYISALTEATNIIQQDIRDTKLEIDMLEAMGQDTDLLRPYYFVIFLSDGIPRVRGGVVQTDDDILFWVQQLLDVPEPALGATLHTAFLGAAPGTEAAMVAQDAETLLRKMAEEGKGIFSNFASGDAIDFSVFDFKILRRHDLKEFVVYNRHAVFEDDFIRADSDVDGVSDEMEFGLGTGILVEDTDGDGFRDGFEVAVALDPLRIDPYCDSDAENDEDKDGLRDCEESFLNFDPKLFDTDKDLFADRLEQYSGANPKDSFDTDEDLDFDGRKTDVEIRERTNPGVSEPEGKYRQYAYHYLRHRKIAEFGGESVAGKSCYAFRIENVGLVATEGLEPLDPGVNELVVEIVEAPEDDPENTSVLLRHIHQTSFFDVSDFSKAITIDLGEFELSEVSRQTKIEE